MSFLSIKSVCFLLIITIAFSSGGVVRPGKNTKGIPSAFTGANSVINPHTLEKVLFKTKFDANQRLLSLGEQGLKMLGELMAQKVFGTAGRKGFSWGWNGSKYYLKAAKNCASYEQLSTSSCIQQPHSLLSLKPNCFAACVIEFTDIKDGTPMTCKWHNDDSCYYDTIQTKCSEATFSQYQYCKYF